MRKLSKRKKIVMLASFAVIFFIVFQIMVVLWPRPNTRVTQLNGTLGTGTGPAVSTMWLGDSTAAGLGVNKTEDSLAWQVAARLGPRQDTQRVNIKVLAKSGARIEDVVSEQIKDLEGLDPDIIFVSVGANDVTHLSSRSAFKKSYKKLASLLSRYRKVVVLGVPDMGSPPRLPQPLRAVAGARGRSLDDEVEGIAKDEGFVYVDIAGVTGSSFRNDPDRYFAQDRYHPNKAGYELWTDAVVSALKR